MSIYFAIRVVMVGIRGSIVRIQIGRRMLVRSFVRVRDPPPGAWIAFAYESVRYKSGGELMM